MELFLFFLIVAVGGVWWLNHTMKKKADADAAASLSTQESQAPYKVDPVPEKIIEIEKPAMPVVAEEKPAMPVVAEEKPKKRVAKPKTTPSKKPTARKKATVVEKAPAVKKSRVKKA